MRQQTMNCILAASAFAVISATFAVAQPSTLAIQIPATDANGSWQGVEMNASTHRRLLVVTLNQPHRRQFCRVESFTQNELECSRPLGGHRTFVPQQVIALLIPGDDSYKIRFVLGANGGLAAAIWATVVLTPVCPPCAVATGIVALGLFGAAGAVLIGDDQPDRVVYLAKGQHLTGKLRNLNP